jgi:putative transposase
VRRTVPPSAEIEQRIDELLAVGLGEDPRSGLSELARLGARLIIQRAVEDEFDAWLGRARYERRPEAPPGLRNGYRPRRLQTAEGELQLEIPQVREAAEPFVSELFPYGTKLLRTEPLRALVIGAFVRGLSMRDVESLCEEAGLGKLSKSTASRICEELRERFEAFGRRDLYELNIVALFCDAIFLATRPEGPKEGVLCAWGFTAQGERALVSVRLGMRESHEDWLELGRDLIARGLQAPLLIVADGAPGLTKAIEQCWPHSDRQHCSVHRLRNLLAKVPKRERERVRRAYWQALDDATDERDGAKRRPRGALCAPALSAPSPPALAEHQPTRALVWRGQAAHQGDRPLPRRAKLPLARLGRARPRHQPRRQRRQVQRGRPPALLPDEIPASRTSHSRGGDRRID